MPQNGEKSQHWFFSRNGQRGLGEANQSTLVARGDPIMQASFLDLPHLWRFHISTIGSLYLMTSCLMTIQSYDRIQKCYLQPTLEIMTKRGRGRETVMWLLFRSCLPLWLITASHRHVTMICGIFCWFLVFFANFQKKTPKPHPIRRMNLFNNYLVCLTTIVTCFMISCKTCHKIELSYMVTHLMTATIYNQKVQTQLWLFREDYL